MRYSKRYLEKKFACVCECVCDVTDVNTTSISSVQHNINRIDRRILESRTRTYIYVYVCVYRVISYSMDTLHLCMCVCVCKYLHTHTDTQIKKNVRRTSVLRLQTQQRVSQGFSNAEGTVALMITRVLP